jgi:hypothetical protein
VAKGFTLSSILVKVMQVDDSGKERMNEEMRGRAEWL